MKQTTLRREGIEMQQHLVIPKRLQLETYYGCNAKCIMCAIRLPPTRKIGPMPWEMSKKVLDGMAPYADRMEKLDLFALGEPLLDPFLYDRIKYAKSKHYKSIGISTNADLLTEERQRKLLEAGIDAVIISIDGIRKETHEAIRRNVTFERVVGNAISFITMRNEGKYPTRIIVRFVRQKCNVSEWEEYRRFWKPKLSKQRGDQLIVYDVNTMGGEFSSKEELVAKLHMDIERRPCHMVFDRLIVLVDGTVPLCCEDTPQATYRLGNVNETSPIEIYNNEAFTTIRETHRKGDKTSMKLCKECTLLYSEQFQQNIELGDRDAGMG